MLEVLTPHNNGTIIVSQVVVFQYVIVRHNCETFVVWAETKEEALKKFHDSGYSDEWVILKKD